jgi:hypothetical protein
VLDVAEIAEYWKAAKLRNFSDAFAYYLAHEFAHIAQWKRARTILKDDPSLVIECNADLWAGIAFVMAQPFDPSSAYQRAKDLVALSAQGGDLFPIGVHLADKVASHPEALQRASCAAKGLNAGLMMFRERQVAAAQASGFSVPPAPPLPSDFEYAGVTKDPWQWSIQTARLISEYKAPEGMKPVSTWGPNEFRSLAAAAERGPETLAASRVLRASAPSAPQCAYGTASKTATAKCSSPAGISERLTFVMYDSAIAMLRPILLSRAWTQESAVRSNKGISETFAYGRALCNASADFSSQKVTIEFVTRE